MNLYEHIVWKYPSSPDVAKIKWYPRTEDIFMFSKGKPTYFNEDMASMSNVWEISHIQENEHPAPFPLALASRCIMASCPSGGLVFDPFMGSGTTALACVKLGINYIGAEISEKYVKYAEKRINAAKSQLSLF